MKNRILLINPPQTTSTKRKCSNFKIPLGFLYLAGILEKQGFIVKIIDCPLYYKKRKIINKKLVKLGLFPEDIKKIIKEFKPTIIGVSCAYSAYESDSFEIVNLVKEFAKEIGKNILVIVGGAHSSVNTEHVLRNQNIDMVVIGEGEATILEIAQKYKNKIPEKIKGTAIRKNGKIEINKPREFIQDISNLNSSWHLLDMPNYFLHPDNSWATLRKPSLDIITSRGCPGNCVFCSIHSVWGKKWRGRDAKEVVDEIQFLINEYGAKQFRIQDDNLTLDKKRIIEICDEIIKRKIDIRWDTPNGVAFWALDEGILKKMKEAGCYRITFGIESACRKTQKYVRKIVDLEKINHLIGVCHKLKMWVCSTFIIGFPYETKQDLKEAKKFILNSRINFPFIYVAQPYPGTDMHSDFKKENLIKEFKLEGNILESEHNTKYFTNIELNKIRNKLCMQFYLKKILCYTNFFIFYREFLSKIRTKEDIKYVFKNLYNVLFEM